MEYTIEEVDPLVRKVKFSIPASEIISKIDDSLRKLRKEVSLPGFRKGKVPIDLIKARYYKSVEAEVFDTLLNDTLHEIIVAEKLPVVGGIVVKSTNWDPEEAFKADIECQVVPNVELKKIDGLKVIKEVHEVTDEDVEKTIERIREEHAVVKQIEVGAQRGHYILADFQELDSSGMPIIGKKFLDRQFLLGSGVFGEKFDEQLLGVKPGDERLVEVSYQDRRGARRTEYYRVNVKKVEEQILPEMDEDFVKSVGEFSGIEELKKEVRRQLEKEMEERVNDRLHANLIDELIKNNPFDLPPAMVDDYLDAWFKDVQKQSQRQLDEKALKERNRPFAVRNLKWHLLMDEILAQENLKVDESVLEAAFNDLAERSKLDVREIKHYYRNKKNRDQLLYQLEEKRVLDRLLETAEIIEVKDSQNDSKIIQTL